MSRWPIACVLGAVIAASAIIIAAMPPDGQQFPLNDDWAFARGAFAFARGEGCHYFGWASMPLWGQWICAWPFIKIDENHFSLRLCTLTLSLVGLISFFDLLTQEEASPRIAALAAALLVFNPLYYLLQGTFLTDIPALAMSLLALALINRAIRTNRLGLMLLGTLAGVAAATTRQNAAVISVVAALLVFSDSAMRYRVEWWLLALAPLAAGAAAHFWLSQRTDVRAIAPSLPSPESLLLTPFAAIHWLGLAVLPLMLLDPRFDRRSAVIFAIMILGVVYWSWLPNYLPYKNWYPYSENMLSPYGAFAGGSTGLLMPGARPVILGRTARIALSALGCLGAAWWLPRALDMGRKGWWTPLGLYTLLQLPFFLATTDIYDRYFLVLLPGVLALSLPRRQVAPAGLCVSLAGVAVLAVISVGLMQDWLAWNHARWSLGLKAVAAGIPPEDIEGGFEWDGWIASSGRVARLPRRQAGLSLPFTRDWFPHVSGRYGLSFSTYPRTRIVDETTYHSWLAGSGRPMYLLAIDAGPNRPTSSATAPNQRPDKR